MIDQALVDQVQLDWAFKTTYVQLKVNTNLAIKVNLYKPEVSDYIVDIVQQIGLDNKKILLSINGSIIQNKFYRKLLEDSLMFDFSDIKWVSSILSPAYGSGLIAANYNGINISLKNLIDKLKN